MVQEKAEIRISVDMENLEIIFLAIVWLVIIFIVVGNTWKSKDKTGGFTFIYITAFFLIYGFAALLSLLPWHRYVNEQWMLLGFREATFGVGAFAFGHLVLSNFFISLLGLPSKTKNVAVESQQAFSSPLPKRYLIIGLVSFIVLPPFLLGLPTITSIMAAAQQLVVAGLCLILWQAYHSGQKRKYRKWYYVALSLPLVSIFFHGFMGIGMMMVMVVIVFTLRFSKPRPEAIIIGIIASYFVLSFYLTYMRGRTELRESMRRQASMIERFVIMRTNLMDPIWFNPFDLQQLEVIDERMNQNILAGAVVEQINTGKVDFAYGATMKDSLIALIPRVFWKEKPITAGGVVTVSKYTGMTFIEETSIGIGQVMEFYINFGRVGVIIGFMIIGVIIAIIDLMSGYYLDNYNIGKFIQWFLPGMCFLMIGGELVEVTASIGASVFLAYLITSRNLFILLVMLYFVLQVLKLFGPGLIPF